MPEVTGSLAEVPQNSLKLFLLLFFFLSAAVVISVTWLAPTGSFFLKILAPCLLAFNACVLYMCFSPTSLFYVKV